MFAAIFDLQPTSPTQQIKIKLIHFIKSLPFKLLLGVASCFQILRFFERNFRGDFVSTIEFRRQYL